MNIALILAGGSGTRMGSDLPKQFLPLRGIPILARTVAAFDRHPMIDEIWIVSSPVWVNKVQEILSKRGFSKVCGILPGGETRQASAFAGISFLYSSAHAFSDLLLIHDAARPLVDEALISECLGCAELYGACTAAIPATDTLLEAENGIIRRVPDRSKLWAAQTPQAFTLGMIYDAHRAYPEGKTATDDAQIAMSYGVRVRVVPGNPRNLKITAPTDLSLAEALLG